MLDHVDAITNIRSRLLGVEVAATGTITLGCSGGAYTRTSGSFVQDGFATGMEVTPAGFGNNETAVVDTVEALTLKLKRTRETEVAAAGRSLTVGLPLKRGWENVKIDVQTDQWFVEEDYLPGPAFKMTLGPGGELLHRPTYVLRVYALENIGIAAIYKMAQALVERFPPEYPLTLADGTILRVTSQPGPSWKQVTSHQGFAAIVLTLPFWARTNNII